MTRKLLVLTVLFFGIISLGTAQKNNLKITSKPADMWEVGLHLGHTLLSGDVDSKSSFGGGIHLRKALDYTFSLRLDAGYYSMKGEEDETIRVADGRAWGFTNWLPEYKSSVLSGDLTFQINLNQIKTGKKKKVNPYIFVGAGIASLNITAIDGNNEVKILDLARFDDELNLSPYFAGGLGIGFLVGKKVSISIEHKLSSFSGRGNDLLDAAELRGSAVSGSSDLLQYTNVRLGIALGKLGDKSLPLWWASPLDMIADDLAEVKARPKLDLTDTDGDGIIDMLDQEKNTVAGAAVDTKGVALDSDGDGVPNHQDKEPYSPPGYNVDDQGVASVPAPDYVTENDVNRIVDAKIKDFKGATPPVKPVEWFLPMINYGNNSYRIKTSEYGKLHNIATAMKQNSGLRVVATGHTDKTSGNCANDKLSYNRAQAAVDYISSKYGIPRERFIINWKGENENLVPTNGGSLMNRRVEFKVATGESDQGAPSCGGGSTGVGGTNYSGNKEAGY